MSAQSSKRKTRRLSNAWERASKPFVALRESFSKRSSEARQAREAALLAKKSSSSTDPSTQYGSTAATSFSEMGELDRGKTHNECIVEQPGLEAVLRPLLTAQETALYTLEGQVLQTNSLRASIDSTASFFARPRRRTLPSPCVSPRARSPVNWDRGCLTVLQALEGIPTMMEQVKATRLHLKKEVEIHCGNVFTDAKVLLKALDKLTHELYTLRTRLGNPSRAILDEIELLDIHLGSLLQEGDRIMRAMRPGKPRLAPLEGRSKSMRKYVIVKDLGPQMLELAQSVNSLEERAGSITQNIVAESAAADAPESEKVRTGTSRRGRFFPSRCS